MILFALRSFLLCCIHGSDVLHVPFIKLSLALSIWQKLVQFFFFNLFASFDFWRKE